MESNKFNKKIQSPYKLKDRGACRFGLAARNMPVSKSKYRVRVLLLLLFIVTFVPIAALTSCKYEKLGISVSSSAISNDTESNVSGTNADPGVLNEQGFYSLKNLQKDKNPLIDLNVRKAIFYAIDRKRIAGELLGSYGAVLNSLFPVGADYYADSWSQYDYDPTAAKEYLNKAGYNEGNPLLLTIGAVSYTHLRAHETDS